jgi:hypothetical protein
MPLPAITEKAIAATSSALKMKIRVRRRVELVTVVLMDCIIGPRQIDDGDPLNTPV